MDHRRDHARRREQPDRRRPDEQPLEPAPADKVLALQRSAGNQAVSAFLARSPDDAKTKEKPKTETAEASGARATLSGIGTIALLSVSFGRVGSPVGGSGGGREGQPNPRELILASRVGEHSAKLLKALIDGRPMAVEVIVPGADSTLRLELTGAIVSNYNKSGEGENATESWTLDFESIEQHGREGDAAE